MSVHAELTERDDVCDGTSWDEKLRHVIEGWSSSGVSVVPGFVNGKRVVCIDSRMATLAMGTHIARELRMRLWRYRPTNLTVFEYYQEYDEPGAHD